MDEQLQRRLIGVVVGVGVILLLLWMIPTQSPTDGGTADSATVSVADAARASQTQGSGAAATPAANNAEAGAASAIPPPPVSSASASIPPATAMTPAAAGAAASLAASSLPSANGQVKPSFPKPAAPSTLQASAESAAMGINPARPSAPLAAALASGLPAKPAPATPVPATKPAVPAVEPAPAKLPAASKPSVAPVQKAVTPPVPAPKVASAVPKPAPVPAVSSTTDQKAPAAAAPGKAWYVQVGSFSTSDKAQLIANLITNAGLSTEVAPIKTGSGTTLYRVRSGPYSSAAKADEALAKLRQQGYPDARRLFE
jgi:cell division septation protein DedD